MLKFFNENVITEEMISMIKENRKRYVSHKVVNYNRNFVEHVSFEKSIKVNSQNDEILQLVEKHLVPCINNYWLENFKLKNYSYKDLPSKLKKYMYQVDPLFFSIWQDRMAHNWIEKDLDKRFERLQSVVPDYTDRDFEDYILLGKSIPTTLGKKAYDSASRAYKEVQSIIKANINLFTHFMTFTFAHEEHKDKHLEKNEFRLQHEVDLKFKYVDGTDFEIAKGKYTEIIKKIKRDGFKFEYLTVWELQQNGAYHFHMLCTGIPPGMQYKIPQWLDYDYVRKKFNHAYGFKDWIYGKSDIQEIKEPARLSTYVSKYILKSFYNVNPDTYEQYLGKKKYFRSTGLVHAKEEYVDKFDYEDIPDDVTPFKKEIVNPYNDGLITKKIYTLIKKEASQEDGGSILSVTCELI